MSMEPKRIIVLTVIILIAIVASGTLAFTSAPAGQWRLTSPTEYTANPASNMHGIFLINGGTSGKGSGNGWAVSDNGFIFYWDGFAWNQANSPTDCQLTSVNFGGPLNPLSNGVQSASGWIVGGYSTVAGTVGPVCTAAQNAVSLYWNGVNWNPYTVPKTGSSAEMYSVFQVTSASSLSDSVNAFAVGQDGTGGAFWQWTGVPGITTSWTEMSTTTNPVNSVYMTHCSGSPCTGDDGIAVGNGGTIFRLVGGIWTALPSPVSVNLNGVAMSSETSGWAVGASCTIVRTTDGNTWTAPFSPGPCTTPTITLRSIVLLSSSEAWAVGDADASGVPVILHGTSLDSSPVWTQIPPNQVTPTGVPSGVGLNSVTFATSGGSVWAVGAGGVVTFCVNNCSSVSGAIWGAITSPLTGSTTAELNSVFMDSDTDGWAVGSNIASPPGPYLIRWNGYSWTQAPAVSPITTSPLFGVYMQGSSNAWAVGGTASLVPSTLYYDGNTWTGRSVPVCSCILKSVFMVSGSESWAVGTDPTSIRNNVMHSTTQGGSFTIASYSGPAANFYTVFFDSSQSGWAGGQETSGLVPIIAHTTTDGADAWAVTFPNPGGLPNGYVISSLFFQDSTHGWAAASSGTTLPTRILYWNGVSWTLVSPTMSGSDADSDLFGISVEGGTPATDGWAVGVSPAGLPVTVHYDGSSWTEMFLTPVIPNTGSLLSLYLRSSTNGLAVGTLLNSNPSTLALVLHLDPPGSFQNTVQQSTTVTNVVTTTSTSTASASTGSLTSTGFISTSVSTMSATGTTTATVVSTSVSTMTVVSTPTTTSSSTSSVSTPMVMPAVPGFPWESIIAGLMLGMAALAILRRVKK